MVDATAEQRAKEALEQEVRAALLVLDAIQEPLLTIDGDGIVTHASRAIETLTGTHPASAIGQSINRLLHLIEHETNRRVIPTQLLRAGGTLPGGLRMEAADSRRHDVELSWGRCPARRAPACWCCGMSPPHARPCSASPGTPPMTC